MESQILFIYVIDCVFFGALIGFIATMKNRSGIAWFFIGALLGILALIVILIAKKLPDKVVIQNYPYNKEGK